jgi:hypothetical protein
MLLNIALEERVQSLLAPFLAPFLDTARSRS